MSEYELFIGGVGIDGYWFVPQVRPVMTVHCINLEEQSDGVVVGHFYFYETVTVVVFNFEDKRVGSCVGEGWNVVLLEYF